MEDLESLAADSTRRARCRPARAGVLEALDAEELIDRVGVELDNAQLNFRAHEAETGVEALERVQTFLGV